MVKDWLEEAKQEEVEKIEGLVPGVGAETMLSIHLSWCLSQKVVGSINTLHISLPIFWSTKSHQLFLQKLTFQQRCRAGNV